MGLTKEQQQEKIRQKEAEEGKSSLEQGLVKRFIKGKLKVLTKKQNDRYNKKTHKGPVIFGGLNTNK